MPERNRRTDAVRGVRRAFAAALLLACASTAAFAAERFDGFNVIAVPAHPYGSPGAQEALEAAQRAGARAIAIVPFLWQRDARDPGIVRGSDMPDAELRLAIRGAHAAGLKVMVKPHVWVPGTWAGAVEPLSEDDWRTWFARYGDNLVKIARIAAEEGAAALSIGTELKLTTQRPEWRAAIAAVRAVYPGLLTYSAHNVQEAEVAPFWGALDAIGVTLYPKLGADRDRTGRQAVMRATADRLEELARRESKPVIVTEIGLRSAEGAAAKPWESAEERGAPPDGALQAEVLADWLSALDRPPVTGVLVWRWFTDPAAGGPSDTDFTVQRKAAERIFLCAKTGACR